MIDTANEVNNCHDAYIFATKDMLLFLHKSMNV